MSQAELRSLEKIAGEIEEVLGKIKETSDEVRELVSRLLELIDEFNRVPLIKIVRHLKSSEEGKKLLMEMASDPDIYALFLKYNIVKKDIRVEIAKIIELIKPYVRSHGGDVELVDVKDDTVFVRMKGACQGCSQVGVTLTEGILEAIRNRFPQIKKIEQVNDGPVEGFLSIQGVGRWVKAVEVRRLKEGEVLTLNLEGKRVLVVLWDGKVFSYVNSCAHQGMGFDGAEPVQKGVLRCPWHGFEYDITTGECITTNQLQLEPVPLKVEEGWVYLKL